MASSSVHTNYVDNPVLSRLPETPDHEEPKNVESIPLINATPIIKPPLACLESDELDGEDNQIFVKPQPGVDDGFFDNNHPKEPKDEEHNPDVETFPSGEFPILMSRAGGDDDAGAVDGLNNKPNNDNQPPPPAPSVTTTSNMNPVKPPNNFDFPNFGSPDVEFGGTFTDLESIPDVNVYQHKKTLAQGMMDLALFSANANQLRYVVESSERHPYFYPSIVFITFSLLLQIAVGIGLIWNATYNVKDKREICIANKINNFTIIGIFLVTIVNVFVSAFGVATPPPKS